MSRTWLLVVLLAGLLHLGCRARQVQAPAPPPPPPAPRQNVFALLEDPEGKATAIVVTNAGGSQELGQTNQAVRVERADVGPAAPFLLTPEEIERLFGEALDALPAAEARFVLYFEEGKDDLTPESEREVLKILDAIRDLRAGLISVVGHTDTTGDPKANYRLGLSRAEQVAKALRARGVKDSSLFVRSHGQADLLVKTPSGVAERRNRRVEVVVR